MLNIYIICVGKLKEKFFIDAVEEYKKRLGAFGRLEIIELPETRLPGSPSASDIEQGLLKEAAAINSKLPKGAYTAAMCIEGEQYGSEEFSALLSSVALGGVSRVCFIIGGSYGLHSSIKSQADVRLSMSKMTFPHHLARVMLLEQLYRAFKIAEGGRYHK